jgi:hypothetical protein
MIISKHIVEDNKELIGEIFPSLKNFQETFYDELIKGIPWGDSYPYFKLISLFDINTIYYLAFGEPKNGFHPLQCLDCAAEHVAKAMVNLDEALKGYDGKIFKEQPDHVPMLIGNIAEAEAQTVRIYSDIARKARALKLKIRSLDSGELRNAKSELNTLFWTIIARKRGAETVKTIQESISVKKPCGCGGKGK